MCSRGLHWVSKKHARGPATNCTTTLTCSVPIVRVAAVNNPAANSFLADAGSRASDKIIQHCGGDEGARYALYPHRGAHCHDAALLWLAVARCGSLWRVMGLARVLFPASGAAGTSGVARAGTSWAPRRSRRRRGRHHMRALPPSPTPTGFTAASYSRTPSILVLAAVAAGAWTARTTATALILGPI
jgi:hypothetical protein